MPPQIFDFHGNPYVPAEDNKDGTLSNYGVQMPSKVLAPDYPCRVPASPPWASSIDDNHVPLPQGDISNDKFH